MPLEDKHLDVLQNIEFAIVSVYRNDPSVRDVDAILALEALTSYFHQKNRGIKPGMPDHLSDKSGPIFSAVLEILALRGEQHAEPAERPRFSRALRATTQEDIYLACLRKIEKSAKRWHKLKGERGYLDFIINYQP